MSNLNNTVISRPTAENDLRPESNKNCVDIDTVSDKSAQASSVKIDLGHGYFALVDADDYDRIRHFNWHVSGRNEAKGIYAFRSGLKRLHEPANRKIRMHHEVLQWKPTKGLVVDHINGDKLDNRKSNLRICTQSENQHNRRKTKNPCTSKFKGVHLTKRESKPWTAQIRISGKMTYIGMFDTAEAAAKEYDRRAMLAFGPHALLNFPVKRLPQGAA